MTFASPTREFSATSDKDRDQVLRKTRKLALPEIYPEGPVSRTRWFRAQSNVAAWLRSHGVSSRLCDYYAPCDLITDGGLRIEVKYAELQYPKNHHRPIWKFNIHRHGVLNEDQVDFYILRCEPGDAKLLLGSAAIHLVLPAPIGKTTIAVTPRSLITRYHRYYNDIKKLNGGQQ